MFLNFASKGLLWPILALLGMAAPLAAQDGPIGSDWHRTPLSIHNVDADEAIACQFLMAHWFEIQHGPIAPGEEIVIPLLVRPQSGDVAILNSVGDRMRVERLACGPAGRDRANWSEPSLDWLRRQVSPATLTCGQPDPTAISGRMPCRFSAP